MKFASEGFNVALLSRKAASASKTLNAINNNANGVTGVRAVHFACDATNEANVHAAFAAVKSEFGSTGHVLLNNVGGGLTSSSNKGMLELSAADFENVWRMMCLSAFLSTQQVLPEMIANGAGTVLFTSSTAAFRGSASSPPFPTAMAGVRMLAQSVAKAHAKNGVHVVHLRIDGVVDNDTIREKWKGVTDAQLVDPASVADLYWFASQQKSRGFCNEIDIRTAEENWTL